MLHGVIFLNDQSGYMNPNLFLRVVLFVYLLCTSWPPCFNKIGHKIHKEYTSTQRLFNSKAFISKNFSNHLARFLKLFFAIYPYPVYGLL